MMESFTRSIVLVTFRAFLSSTYQMAKKNLGDIVGRYVQHRADCPTTTDPPSGSQNIAEVRTVARLVRLYYQYEKFCVITPYDAQRSAIEKQLKSEFLPWQHVFSVDSFQGWFDLLFP